MSSYRALCELLNRFAADPAVAATLARIDQMPATDLAALITAYQAALREFDGKVAALIADETALALYQAAFRELEALIAAKGDDRRHRFVVVIPVADRPRHLGNILNSLLELCEAYRYGGSESGRFRKLTVVVVDDSGSDRVVSANRAIIRQFNAQGVETIHFDADQQARQLAALPPSLRAALDPIVGRPERTGFSHKGASVTRNIAYLRLHEMAAEMAVAGERGLFFFVDSDEQFKVRVAAGEGCRDRLAINYFYQLDRIFSEHPVDLLTGKVVGDPPVSPAVMAANFLDDLSAFVEQLAAVGAEQPCRFHSGEAAAGGDAAYHDMADLFGFTPAKKPFRYRCTLAGPHDHRACLAAFADRLDGFFDGEHPTRITLFAPDGGFPALKPARTVYTGNYVCTAAALRWFIPFAPLKLRMAGPVLGRLIRAAIGERFVTADLPLLHTRTIEADERFEFRPGVDRQAALVDLSGEFERQFFGDIMLFTMEALIEAGYPDRMPGDLEIERALDAVEAMLQQKYLDKRALIRAKLSATEALFESPAAWWQQLPELTAAREAFSTFFANLRTNFGDDAAGYRLIAPGENRDRRRAAIRVAIAGYPRDQQTWREALAGRAEENA